MKEGLTRVSRSSMSANLGDPVSLILRRMGLYGLSASRAEACSMVVEMIGPGLR